MTSFLQYGSQTRTRAPFRPIVIGALTCGALMMSAGPAQANHRMADGTLCPHANGELAPGETPAAAGPTRAATSGPIGGTTRSAAPAARPAAKPATKAPAQRPASQAQAQQPAASQAQAQRPATASQPATIKTNAPATAQRQVPVARPSVVQQPQAKKSTRSSASRPASRPAVEPTVATVRSGVPVERPAAYTIASADRADAGSSFPTTLLLSLLALAGIFGAGVVAVRSRLRRVKDTGATPTFVESMDAAIEAELQAIISETAARMPAAEETVEDEDLELIQPR